MQKLINAAMQARMESYSPYSGYSVGAAVLTASGEIFSGCNIENASYGATMCAERTAIFSAIAAGHKNFTAIAIVGGKDGEADLPYPCGMCRQVLSEFCDKDFKVIIARSETDFEEYTLGELLPHSFLL
ncbi:MAG: cytidine deaminase [Clostridia bacterium]|nr:cytidine deaminase [Clostridia bacterium]